jgi:DNA-binding FadR family transcriptional regulator
VTAHFDARRTVVPNARRTSAMSGFGDGAAGTDNGGTDKLAARVARDIENDIIALNWPVGDVLGSEAELRAHYRVSRAVLREAIRLVEHHQVASMRRGPAGGLVVRAPDAGPATNAMIVYLAFVGTTVEHVLAARILLEPLAAALAAENINEAGIALLRAALAAEELPTSSVDLTHLRNQVHLVIAQLTGNPALRLFVDVLLRLTSRYAHESLTKVPDAAHPVLIEGHQVHDELVSAVVAGESARAEHQAGEHLEAIAEFIHGRASDPGQPLQPSFSIWGTAAPGHTQDQKLAEVVARRIITEISEGGWTIGSVIGSETALLDRFEVSRAVLREAVRLLEYHSVARMRRGPGGGLVVARPDPTASIEAMSLYLDYQRIEINHLRVVRERVEIGCVDYVSAMAGDPDVAHRLRLAGNDDGVGLLEGLPHRLHTEIAELSGNPVLALFLRILTTLWARKRAAMEDEPETAAAPGAEPGVEPMDQVHKSLVEALIAGDPSLARHRMRRHLETLTDWWQ